MSEQNFTIARDLNEAESMAEGLVPYIYEDELYGRLAGKRVSGGNIPALTLGALLLRLRRLRALRGQMEDAQRQQLERAQSQHDSVFREWRLHYEGKLVKEVVSRLDAIMPYFDECEENPRLCASAYMPEALRRTIVQEILLIMADLGLQDAAVTRKRRQVDDGLRRFVKPSDFVWSEILEPVYPKDTFWWLYHKPDENAR